MKKKMALMNEKKHMYTFQHKSNISCLHKSHDKNRKTRHAVNDCVSHCCCARTVYTLMYNFHELRCPSG